MADKAELQVRFDRVLSALQGVIETVTALDPAWEESRNGVVGAYADAAVSLGQARIAFENETPTMDALAIHLKDSRYKDPSWPADGADDAQILRTVWHSIHDKIVAGKSFATDDLSVMRNLNSALESARETCGPYDRDGGEATDPPVALGDGRFLVGDHPISLEGRQSYVLDALVDLRTASMSQLAKHSGVDDVARQLKRICERFPQLAAHITLPGGRGKGGYSTTIRKGN